jgi:3-isopropylmalate/(R)-2-methylmalate dehydratase small subunit
MKELKLISGKCVPIAIAHINTDLIIPAKYLTSTEKTGYGNYAFQHLRESKPEFPLNLDKYKGSKILLTLENFGCGSSREHAVWALMQYGFEAIIAPSFSDIFYNNSIKNRLPLIKLPENIIQTLIKEATDSDLTLEINLEQRTISSSNQTGSSIGIISFEMDSYTQYRIINGVDDLDYLLEHLNSISNYFTLKQDQGGCFYE